ncbi:MAG: hypothetical protein IMY67_06505 [Bacteroidetes bacterium]|nr:hypothetical protein [Bacteroidota bacterium]
MKNSIGIIIIAILITALGLVYLAGYKIGHEEGQKIGHKAGYETCKKELELPVTVFTITRTQLRFATSLSHRDNKWTKLHVIPLHDGLNVAGARVCEGQRVEFRIWNY